MRLLRQNQHGNRRGPLQPQQQPHEVNIWAQHGRDFPPNQQRALFNRPLEIADSQQALAVQELRMAAATPINAGRNTRSSRNNRQSRNTRPNPDQHLDDLLRRHAAGTFR